jgi:hypothetical protein
VQPRRGMSSDHATRIVLAAWPGILLVCLVLLPWLGKAHTIDDVTFLLQAEHVLKDPLHPTAFEMLSDHNRIRVSSQLVSGPVMAWLLIPCALLGGAEWAAHLLQFLLMLAAICATVSLSYRLGADVNGARMAGLILASTPAVLVMATTSMSDVPAMAFGVLGMERFLAWHENHRWHQCLLTSLFFALAALSRPHMILLLAVASVIPIKDFMGTALQIGPSAARTLPARERWFFWVAFIPILLSGLITTFIALITADPAAAHQDFVHVTVARFQPTNLASNTAAFLLHWTFAFPLTLLWFWMGVRWRTLWRNPAVLGAIEVTIYVWYSDKRTHTVSQIMLFFVFIGAFVLLDILFDCWSRREGTQFFLCTWLLIALPVIYYVQLPSKYLVGSAPAVAILLARLWSRRKEGRSWIPGIAISAGICLSLLIIAADARFTEFGKMIAQEQIAPRVKQGVRVWINSEWGFEWYALKAGAIPAANQPPYPAPGDVLVSSSAAPHIPLERFPHRRFVGEFREFSRFGQIMNLKLNAGFYSNAWGFLPWTCRNGLLEIVTIWTIS